MTNIERQKSLDKQKWLISKQYGEDLSGKMIYCLKCEKNCYKCIATQKEREEQTLCAKAYNRMKRQKSKGATK
jgi:hypothetical protein